MSLVKWIDRIEVTNIKGISNREIKERIYPNKPIILVAPNGFGKSSLAAGFASLKPSKLELNEDLLHQGNAALLPKLIIDGSFEDGTTFSLVADGTSNGIGTSFDVHVMNSRLVPKAKTIKVPGGSFSTGSIDVQDFKLIKTIPPKPSLKYSLREAREKFGRNGKILPNISELVANFGVLAKIGEIDVSKAKQVRVEERVAGFIEHVNSLNGTAPAIAAAVDAARLQALKETTHLAEIASALNEFGFQAGSEVALYCAAMQFADLLLAEKATFKAAKKYQDYLDDRDFFVDVFRQFKATWKGIAPNEQDGALCLNFPKANQISNGERDTLCLIASLLMAQRTLKKENGIILIDELFDYLDDANLVSCQYYLTKMAAAWKNSGRRLFPIIMTHLDPGFFRNFTFNKQQVVYLASSNRTRNGEVEKIISKREEATIKDKLAHHFLHYDPAPCDLSPEFAALDLNAAIGKSGDFYAHVDAQAAHYLGGRSYDPISVCCAVRVAIERKAYDSLDPALRQAFLDTHKTVEKLNYAQEQGVEIPEAFFLLGVIYNEALHFRKGSRDNVTPLFSKLDNLTIKGMIKEYVFP